jgi:hypothetical protein
MQCMQTKFFQPIARMMPSVPLRTSQVTSMSLPLSCACGARFEVAETFAGQSIACPECQQALDVPASGKERLRTSGYAVTSAVLALVGMFTVVLTVLAVILGLIGLVSISRNRARASGSAYAVFGIVVGVVFTGLTLFALGKEELFDQFREKLRASEADYSGPMEIIRAHEGFAITRPSPRWGVARNSFTEDADGNKGLILVNAGKDAYVQVLTEFVGARKSLDQCMEDFVDSLRGQPDAAAKKGKVVLARSGMHIDERRRLPALGSAQVLEVRVEMRLGGSPLSYLIRAYKEDGHGNAFIVSSWTHRRHFARVEPALRQALDSFRLLKKD